MMLYYVNSTIYVFFLPVLRRVDLWFGYLIFTEPDESQEYLYQTGTLVCDCVIFVYPKINYSGIVLRWSPIPHGKMCLLKHSRLVSSEK